PPFLHNISHSFFFHSYRAPLYLHSFPTRRSSDLHRPAISTLRFDDDTGARRRRAFDRPIARAAIDHDGFGNAFFQDRRHHGGDRDRKSTRLNSSHVEISYAVFCLKKKKTEHYSTT